MKTFLRSLITLFVFVLLAYLPVVPISKAPVVLNATYSPRMVNTFDILSFTFNAPDGVSYRYYWYTYAVLLVLLGIGCLAGVLLFRKWGKPSQ